MSAAAPSPSTLCTVCRCNGTATHCVPSKCLHNSICTETLTQSVRRRQRMMNNRCCPRWRYAEHQRVCSEWGTTCTHHHHRWSSGCRNTMASLCSACHRGEGHLTERTKTFGNRKIQRFQSRKELECGRNVIWMVMDNRTHCLGAGVSSGGSPMHRMRELRRRPTLCEYILVRGGCSHIR